MIFDDSDIKIAGEKSNNSVNTDSETEINAIIVSAAKKLGEAVAVSYIGAVNSADFDDYSDSQMIINKRILLSFTVSVALDEFCISDTVSGIAEKSFLDTVHKKSPELFENCSDTGAFSFYYLAYRRKTEVDRRIGQTFAMLCSHDGDSIYQELGEALYCWFFSAVKSEIEKAGLQK